MVAPSSWTELGGTFVFPPADAPAGCRLSMAAIDVVQAEAGDCSTLECPDLFVDDASVTLQ